MLCQENKLCTGIFLTVELFCHKAQRHLLGAEGEGCTGDGGGEVEAPGDLPPDLPVNDLHQAALLCHQLVEPVQVQHLFGHDGDAVHRSS